MGIEERFEYATDRDKALNYCLWPYEAPAPAEDKFRSVNLLYQTFDVAGIDERAFGIVDVAGVAGDTFVHADADRAE